MEFLSPAKEASAEIEARRSRFIGTVAPVSGVDEAEAYVVAVRGRYPGATHNVYAYSVGTGTPLERLSDDGEPKGTAGYPVLEVIKKRELRNVVCVVTRYFGGTLLGAGGLLRAYGKAASAAFDAAGTARYVYHEVLSAVIDYDQFGRLQRELDGRGIKIIETSFTDRVLVRAYVMSHELESLTARVRDMTSGRAEIDVGDGRFIPV